MEAAWWVTPLIIGIGALVWSVFLDIRYSVDRRLADLWLAKIRTLGAWAGPFSFLISATALIAFCLLVVAGFLLGQHFGSPYWSLITTIPGIMAYVPFLMATVPAKFSAYSRWRSELRSSGAVPKEQRSIAWWAGPPSILGIVALTISTFWMFNPAIAW